MWGSLSAFPIATVSAAAFYAVVLALLVPVVRERLLPAPGGHGHLAGFDAIRGLAAASVALAHGWYFTYPVFRATQMAAPGIQYAGQGAVPVFCVLSGFLIYRAVLRVRSLEALRAYAIRRFFRIYPVYVLGVALAAGLGQYAVGPHSPGPSSLAQFVADLAMFRVLWWPSFANPVAWSLYFEVVFYAALPFAVLVLSQRRMLTFTLCALAAMLLADYPSRDFGLWRFFLIGVAAHELSPRLKPAAAPLCALGAALMVPDLLYGQQGDWVARLGLGVAHGDTLTWGLGLGCGLMLASLPHLRIVSRALEIAPLRLLGAISYSVYILHPLYIRAAVPETGILVAGRNIEALQTLPSMPAWYLPLVFLPGVLFWGLAAHLAVERPGIRFGRWLTDRLPAPVPRALPAVAIPPSIRS